jgi:predicted AAA+ superfamily ATPase
VISSLLEKIPSALSYNSIANDIGISHNTVKEYIEFLQDLLLFSIAYLRIDKQIIKRKEKKIFALDPFILGSMSAWTGRKFLESALYENIVQSHFLARFGEVYYFRNSLEIDIISGDLRVEIKAGKPHRKYPKGVIVLSEEDIPIFLIDLWTRRMVI